MRMVRDTIDVESTYIPDTTLHHLNGEFVVHIAVTPRGWIWMSPDDADAFAEKIKSCASLARQYKESSDL